MKLFYTAYFILFGFIFCFYSNAQNWKPFPYQQTTYFANSDTAVSPNNFYEYKNDTIGIRGPDSVLFFNRFPIEGNHNICYYNIKTMLGDTIQFDTLILSNAKYYYFLNGDTAMLNPLALPGDSWIVYCANGGNNFDHIVISCDSENITSIFGVDDSVKYFSLHAYNGSTPVNYYNNQGYRLSKNLGLLNFIPFRFWLLHPNGITIPTYTIRGLKTSTNTLGFKLPTFEDYFSHYHVGNVYGWVYDYQIQGNGGYGYSYGIIDSVVKVDTAPGVVKIYFISGSRGYYQNDSSVFYKSDYEDIIDKTPPHLGFQGRVFTNDYEYTISKNQISSDSCFETIYTAFSNSSVDTACVYTPPFEGNGYFSLCSKIGLISYGDSGPTQGFSFFQESWSMTGYKLFDGSYCNPTGFPLSVNTIKEPSIQCSFYPNPFLEQTVLNIYSSLPVSNYTLTLTDVTGRIVKNINSISSPVTTISRDGLPSGIYFYQLASGGIEISNGKLMVQ